MDGADVATAMGVGVTACRPGAAAAAGAGGGAGFVGGSGVAGGAGAGVITRATMVLVELQVVAAKATEAARSRRPSRRFGVTTAA